MIFLSLSPKRNLFSLSVILFLSLNLAAQDLDKIASLQHQLKSAKGNKRFVLLNKIAFEYRSSYPDSTIAYGLEAIDFGRQSGIKEGLAAPLNYIGLGNYYKGNLVRAYEYYEEAAREATMSVDSIQLGYAQNNIGRLFSEQGMLTQSYPYFTRAEAIFRSTHDQSGLAYVYQSFAALYKTEQDFVKSKQRYQEALKIRLKLKNTRDIMSGMVLLGKLYMEIKRYDDALFYLQKADSAGRVIHDNMGLAETRILMAEYYMGKKEPAKAKELCEAGLAYVLNSSNVRLVPRAYLVLGEIYFRENNLVVAKKYFTIALSVSSHMRYLDLSMQSHYFLWKISERSHNREDELYHSNQYLVLKDSVNDIRVSGKLAKFQFQTEIERKQRENEVLKANQAKNETIIEHQNQQRLILVILAVLISAMAWVQWRNARRRKEMNAALGKMVDEQPIATRYYRLTSQH
jgi:tetratricopeptide (TPR) repeat protein